MNKRPGRFSKNLPGLFRTGKHSHGTDSSYSHGQAICSFSIASLFAPRVRPSLPGRALEPTLLPRAGVSASGPALAGGETAARGHAATRFLKIFATVLAAMNLCRQTPAHQLDIAVPTVVRRCDACEIVNVNGCSVIVKRWPRIGTATHRLQGEMT